MVSLGFEGLGFGAKVKDAARHLTLPVVTLVVGTLPVLVKHVRAAMIEVLDSAFLRAARGHGIPRQRLLFRYALPAAAKDRKSTRLNSSHRCISYAVFCLKKKKINLKML